MNIRQENGTLSVTGLRQLNAVNTPLFRSALASAFSHDLKTIVIDLSQTRSVDGAGLGALVALFETANHHRRPESVTLRLTNPNSTVRQMLELARLHHLFAVTTTQTKVMA